MESPGHLRLIFRPYSSLICSSASALPRASSTRVVGVLGLPQMLEVDEHVPNHALVERAEVGGTVAERVFAEEVVEVPVDELPVEAVVVGNEHGLTTADLGNPVGELLHHGLRVVELQRLFPRETAHLECLGNPLVGDRLQPSVERPVQGRFDHDGPEADHRIVARDRAVRFHVHHDVGHSCPHPPAFSFPSRNPLDAFPLDLAASFRFRSGVYFHHGLAGSPAMNRTAAMKVSSKHGS